LKYDVALGAIVAGMIAIVIGTLWLARPDQAKQDASERRAWIRECAKHRPVEDCRRDYWAMESEAKP
jgi:hypothetical protein